MKDTEVKKALVKFILNNRSLAENDPKNLVGRGNKLLDTMSENLTKESFNRYVYKILDANE